MAVSVEVMPVEGLQVASSQLTTLEQVIFLNQDIELESVWKYSINQFPLTFLKGESW